MDLLKKIRFFWILHPTLFLIFIFLSPSCDKRSSPSITQVLTSKEKTDLDHLFKHLLFRNHGAFVLFGSKPISELTISPKLSDEEENRVYARLTEEQKKHIVVDPYEYDLMKCWETWQKVQSHFQTPCYLLIERPLKIDPRCKQIFLVNIERTFHVLAENYELFRSVTGEDFDPLLVIYEMEDSSSLFWSKVAKNQTCWGLLFGYGRANAHMFPIWLKHKTGKQGQFLRRLSFEISNEKWIPSKKLSHRNFTIPHFRSLQNDERIIQYKKELKEIKAIYGKGDFLETTLAELTR